MMITDSTSKVTLKDRTIGYMASINVNSRFVNDSSIIRIIFGDSPDYDYNLTYYINSESCLKILSSCIINIKFGISTYVVNSKDRRINELIIIIRLRMKLLYHLIKQVYIIYIGAIVMTYVVTTPEAAILNDLKSRIIESNMGINNSLNFNSIKSNNSGRNEIQFTVKRTYDIVYVTLNNYSNDILPLKKDDTIRNWQLEENNYLLHNWVIMESKDDDIKKQVNENNEYSSYVIQTILAMDISVNKNIINDAYIIGLITFEYIGYLLINSYIVMQELSESWDYNGFVLIEQSFYYLIFDNLNGDMLNKKFRCNIDIIQHSGNGLFTLRIDAIHQAEIRYFHVYNLFSKIYNLLQYMMVNMMVMKLVISKQWVVMDIFDMLQHNNLDLLVI